MTQGLPLAGFALAVSPSGHLRLVPAEKDEDSLSPDLGATLALAFEGGQGPGLLHLGLVEVSTPLPTAFAYFRDIAQNLVALFCSHPDLETVRQRAIPGPPPEEWLTAQELARPPIAGAEYITIDVLAGMWRELGEALARAVAKVRGPLADWLRAQSSSWIAVGRVCFHLAENKRDPETPFAFLATYTTRLSARGDPQHRPLGHAIEESRTAGDRERLLSLLAPVARAASESPLVRAMVDRGDVYHPLSWTPAQAYAFLTEVPTLEAAGVTVRVPDWWSASSRPRARVRVTVGGAAPSMLSVDAILDFSVGIDLDGEALSPDETRAILEATEGLVFIKGKWVEAGGAHLREALERWNIVERTAKEEGVSFHQAMRMLAGSGVGDPAGAVAEETREWSRVEAGPWMQSVLDGLRAPERLAAIDTALGADLRASLRPYQRVGVQWLWWAHELGVGVCLADDMGLGKTLQVIALLLLRKRERRGGPALIVLPASLVGNWSAEAECFCPTLTVQVAHAASTGALAAASIRPEAIDSADAVLTTYGSLARLPWLLEREWGLVVLDEAQAIKNPGAQQTRLVKALRGRARLALTGTPIENRLGDLWSLFDFLAPGLLGTASQFASATKRMAARKHDGYAPLRKLVRPYMLRRAKTDKSIISDLPDKTEVTAYCGLRKVQMALYERAVHDLSDALESPDGMKRRGVILAALLRFKQICNHPSQWLGDGAWSEEASGKFSRLREICEPIAARQEKVLVFTQFRAMTVPLADFLGAIFGHTGLILDGSVPVRERKSLVEQFQNERGPGFFVISLKAGGTGLNLTAASHVIHFDRWWNPAVENQATDRAFRIGQKKNIVVHKFVCRGTVEERIDALVASKRSLSDALEAKNADTESRLTELSNEELMKIVTLDLAGAISEST